MITFFTHLRPYDPEFGPLQIRSMRSWREAIPDGCEIFAYGPGDMNLSELFVTAEAAAANDLLCEISSDILLSGDFLPALEAIQDIERPFVIGQRHDQQEDGSLVLHPLSAADYFIYRKGTLGDIPPFHIGRTAYDNWLIWAAIDRGLTVIDATAAITAVHQRHSYPEYGNRALMLQSKERDENIRMAFDTGMAEWHNIDAAPYVLNGSGVKKRGSS